MTRSARWRAKGLRRFVEDETGQALVWVVVMLPLFLAVIGLTLDGGLVFGARRELQNVADAAARAGAMQIDVQAYRDSGGQRLVLDPRAAEVVAGQYLASQKADLRAQVEARPEKVVVEVSQTQPTAFLRLFGVESAAVSARAEAVVRHGIERAIR